MSNNNPQLSPTSTIQQIARAAGEQGFSDGETFLAQKPLNRASTPADIDRVMARATQRISEAFVLVEGVTEIDIANVERRLQATLDALHVAIHNVADHRASQLLATPAAKAA